MKLVLELRTELGNFNSETIDLMDEKFEEFKKITKEYYHNGYEVTLSNGDFIVVPPNVVKNSILIIKKDEG